MFNNLIESNSHAKEFKRRGSFLLFTTATYVVLFVITGVISIYAYDAHLESQSTELEITFVPLLTQEEAPPEIQNTTRSASNSDNQPTRSIRTDRIDSATNPTNPPPIIGTVASTVLPWRQGSFIGNVNVDPPWSTARQPRWCPQRYRQFPLRNGHTATAAGANAKTHTRGDTQSLDWCTGG
jgi:hypothetical protein